jgi:hypothetical protein
MKCCYSILLVLIAYSVRSQPVIPSASIDRSVLVAAYHEVQTPTLSAQWTVGELITETFTTDHVTASNGINESQVVFLVTGLENIQLDEFSLAVHPNPFTEKLTLETTRHPVNELVISFYDATGKKMEAQLLSIEENKVTFSTENFTPGFYLMNVSTKQHRTLKPLKLIRK